MQKVVQRLIYYRALTSTSVLQRVRITERNAAAAKWAELFSSAKKRWWKTRERGGGTAAQQLWQLWTWTFLYKEWHKCFCLEEGYTVISLSFMPFDLPTDIFYMQITSFILLQTVLVWEFILQYYLEKKGVLRHVLLGKPLFKGGLQTIPGCNELHAYTKESWF